VQGLFVQLADVFMDVYGNDNPDPDGPYQRFLDYFEQTWIGRGRARPPRFNTSLWNNRNITMEGMPRTTNSAESWHNVFANIFRRHHPNPHILLNALLAEQVLNKINSSKNNN
jgi:hypothetical protein